MVHDNGNCKNALLLNHHLFKNNQLHDVEKFNAKELYSFSIFFINTKPTFKKYFQNQVSGVQLVWSDIYSLPRIITTDSVFLEYYTRCCIQIQKLFIFDKTDTKLSSFCNLEDETNFDLLENCTKTNIPFRVALKKIFDQDIIQF